MSLAPGPGTTKTICRSPRCGDVRLDGDLWCLFHRELFNRVAAELNEAREHVNRRAVKKRVNPVCTFDDCYELRAPGEPFCAPHAALVNANGRA